MTEQLNSFPVGIELPSILDTIADRIYDTPYAFIRENLQNAIDACRMQARRDEIPSSDPSLRIDILVNEGSVIVHDRGIGMSPEELRHLFWTIGASGKRNEEARAAGCVGMFGIGGFANFGVCDKLTVTSQAKNAPGQRTELTRSDIDQANGLPRVALQASAGASPRGTIVEGLLRTPADPVALRQYTQEIVRYCHELIYFNGELISGEEPRSEATDRVLAGSGTWSHDDVLVTGTLYLINDQTLGISLEEIQLSGNRSRLSGTLRFEGNGIDIRKQGFQICTTSIATRIGVSGYLDCDLLAPTAGRDSLNAESSALVSKIAAALERAAVLTILESSELIEQHTRIFRYVRSNGLADKIGKVVVQVAGGGVLNLDEVIGRSTLGSQVYFGTSGNVALTNVLRTRGHLVLNLPSDNHKSAAIRDFLSGIGARDLRGEVECTEGYNELSRFEKAFLGELSETISDVYQVKNVQLVPGSLTEDIPIFVVNPTSNSNTALRIYVDVRHAEIEKLARLGMTPLFRSLVSEFCREYLGSTLRSRSPKFFGSGAVNLDWLAQHRSEAWILLTNDIAVVSRAVRRQVVTATDIHVVTAGPRDAATEPNNPEPKLVRITEGGEDFQSLDGYYLRIPNSASVAYGDMIIASDDHGAVWMGNKILLVASDAISTAFQFEIRLDDLMIDAGTGTLSQGAVVIERSIQQLFGGLYFPLPTELEQHLVPMGSQKIRIEVRCDWLDFAGSRGWEARDWD